jgi:hypothetical protein
MIPQFPESNGSKSIVLADRDSTSELGMFSNSQQYSEGEYFCWKQRSKSQDSTFTNCNKSDEGISSHLCNNFVNSAIANSGSPYHLIQIRYTENERQYFASPRGLRLFSSPPPRSPPQSLALYSVITTHHSVFRHNCLFVIHRRAPLPTAAYNPHPPIRIPTHSLLLVSHEARHEALRHFTASLQLHNSNPKIPINPDIDILYLAAHSNYITRSSLKNIKHLSIDCFY